MLTEVARERTGPVAAALSAVALAMVFAAAGRRVPAGLLPRAPDAVLAAIPHVNVAISVAAIATIVTGWRAARAGRYDRHRTLMLASLGLFAGFLVLYLYRVALLGPQPFPGPDVVYAYGYLPLLAVHVLLAVVCVPLVVYVALLGLTRSNRDLRQTLHARVGRVAAALWLVSFTLGVAVYLLLHVAY